MTMIEDRAEATELAKSIRPLLKVGGADRVTLETSEGKMEFHQITNRFASIFPVDNRYRSLKTGKINEVNGHGLNVGTSVETIAVAVLKVLQRMHHANQVRRSATVTHPDLSA